MDWNALSLASFIGKAEVDFSSLEKNKPKEFTVTLLSKEGKNDKPRGTLTLSLTKLDIE